MVAYEEFAPLVPKSLLDRLAVSLGVNAPNQVRLPGQTVFVCLLNNLANHPVVTQRLLEETATELTGHSIDHSSFGKRLARLSPAYFEAIFTHLYRKVAGQMTPGDQQAQRLRTLRTLWEASPTEDAAGPPPRTPPEAAGPRAARVETPCRLVRVELAVFENSNDAASPSRRKKWEQLPLVVLVAERWDQRSQQWKPLVLLTNLPLSEDEQAAGPFTFAELLEVYRRRWGIELLFKFLKQQLSYDHLTSRNENGIRVMILMALITAVLLIWYQRRTQIDRGWR